ncbi:MAG: MscS Mechanosensitive ion channel [Caulobacteraceae bacterium]|nr:MscS Mechanosensitive ion channel [Caulobacteraceae bacterium]
MADPLLNSLGADQAFFSRLADTAGQFAVSLAGAAVILIATFWAAGWLSKAMRAAMARVHRRGQPPDPTLQTFMASLTRYTVVVVGLIAVLQRLGVQATSILAVLGAASLAVGLALQGALSNVAAGVMLLLFRPFRVGDVIEIGTRKGQVKALDLFVTEMDTPDNLKIIIPNSKVFGDVIVNYSANRRRRVDAVFRIPAAADLRAVMAGLVERAKADPRVLPAPAPPPWVEVTGMAEVWVEGVVHAWVMAADAPAVSADLLLTARLLATNPTAAPPPLPKGTAKAPARSRAKL